MTLTPKSFKSSSWVAAIAAMLALSFGVMGCAGSKSKSSGGSDYASLGGDDSGTPTISPSQQRVDEAKRSAEEAEEKAHDLRSEKAKAKASGN